MSAGRETVTTMKFAIEFIVTTWNVLKITVIQNCFLKSKFRCADVNSLVNEIVAKTNVENPLFTIKMACCNKL